MPLCWSAVRSVVGGGWLNCCEEDWLVADSGTDKIKRARGRPKGYPKTGGRLKGVKNKAEKRDELLELIEATGCVHPLQGLAEVAVLARKDDNLDLATTCYKELAQYVAPKRRAVEHTTEVDDSQPLVIVLPDRHVKDVTPTTQLDGIDVSEGEIV